MIHHGYRLISNEDQTKPSAFNFKQCLYRILPYALFLYIILYLRLFQETEITNSEIQENNGNSKPSPIFQSFFECVTPKLLPLKGNYKDFWFNFTEVTSPCDDLEVYKSLDIRHLKNTDEIKNFVFPRKNETISMVTLGIGHDVLAEMGLKKVYPNIEFFGADPSREENEQLYEQELGGKYYQYSVSDKNRASQSIVLEKTGYKKETTQHIPIDSFIRDIIQKKKIDVLWMDIEGNEYPILAQLHRNGTLDTEGIRICQMNVEMHKDTGGDQFEMQKFHDFVWKILDDGKYILMKPVFVKYKYYRFIRLFIVNVFDEECTSLYLE